MKRFLIFFCTALGMLSFAQRAGASVPPTFSFPVAKAPHPLPLDPSLTDPAWQAGKVPTSGAWENVTRRKPADAGDATTVYMLYDDRAVYIGFVAEQAGAPIVSSQTTNDVGFGSDDFVGVGIDTSGAGSQSYFFETTPRGVRYQQASENVRFRPQWQSAAKIDGTTYRGVLIVPLDIMRIRPGSPQTWRVGFFRQIASLADHISWAYDGVMQDQGAGNWPNFNDLRFWPSATGFDLHASVASRPKPRAEIYGLESIGYDRTLFQQSNGAFLTQKVRPLGVDVSIPVTQTINLVGTANPDFSNVEIDQQTISPQEFRRQLQEYRPFFAQGAQYTNPNPSSYSNFNGPPDEVFYSPSIGPFDRGEKLEGTYGLQSFGVLNFRGFNQVTGDTFDDTAYGFKHALQDQTFLYWSDGVLAHHSIAGTDATIEAGVKGRNLRNGFVYSANTAFERGSWVPQGTTHETNAFVDVHKPNYEWLLGYADVAPNFNPIDGYSSNSDIRGFQGFAMVNGSSHGVKNYSLNVVGDRLLDRSGAVHENDAGAYLNATFNNGFSVNGLGPTISGLRSYDIPASPDCTGATVGASFFTGFPCYRNGTNVPFNIMGLPLGYGDGTPKPIDFSANWGKFGNNELHLYTLGTSRPLGSRYTLGLEYDGSYERDRTTGILDSQWLRRVSLGIDTGSDSNFTISLRDISGHGGFAPQTGLNLSAAFHLRLRKGDLYLNYGTPAAFATLDRFIVKYVIRAGADAGT
ncbi:MAG: hypothetical protein M3M96_05000 [Candidatus Eremiobacteraeota bacterium]|nr:hypothetical protein [Candidatus Eremiobacteraeota bacterium]